SQHSRLWFDPGRLSPDLKAIVSNVYLSLPPSSRRIGIENFTKRNAVELAFTPKGIGQKSKSQNRVRVSRQILKVKPVDYLPQCQPATR
ncbi:MAG: hypothetical protein WCJ40_15080, partial [Planctomycetota bacterium]